MIDFKLIIFVVGLFISGFVLSAGETTDQVKADTDPDKEEWVELFNGENLDGWDIKITGYELNDNFANTVRVEDGLMKVRYDGYEQFNGRFAHIFYEEPFSYYRLRVEYRFVGEQAPGGPGWAFRNNGIMFHSQSAQSMELDQDFPNSIEFQLVGGDGENDRPNGSICTPGTHAVIGGELRTEHCVSSAGPTNHGDEWVTAELIAHGSSKIKHLIDGEVVMEYSRTQLEDGHRINGGYFALQGESHPTDIRSVQVLNLEGCMDEQARNYKSYYLKHNPYKCQFD